MRSSELLGLSVFATLAVAQTEYVQTFSSQSSESQPAPIPGIDRGLKWSGIKPVTRNDVSGTGLKPDGTYYGVFDSSAPVTITADYPGSKVASFSPTTDRLGCAYLKNGKYTPTQDCSVHIQAVNQTGVVGDDFQTYPLSRACALAGSTPNDCVLYPEGFQTSHYTNLKTLTFTLQPSSNPSLGQLLVYLDDLDYTVKAL